MAFQPGHTAYFLLDATEITSYLDSASLGRVRDTLETTTFGNTDRTYLAGLRSGSIDLSGPWDPTCDATLVGADDGAVVAYEFGPEGDTAADIKYSGNALFSNYSVSSSVDGRVEWSASFQPTGTITRGTF